MIHAKRGLDFTPSGDDVEITIAQNGGACFGVVRAIKLGHQALRHPKGSVFSLGPIIHNPMTVEELQKKGMQVVDAIDKVSDGTVVVRSHGIRREMEKQLRERGIKVIDATCPLVKKPQRIAQSIGERGLYLVVVGDAKHPEVQGVVSYYGKPDFLVTYEPGDVDKIPADVKGVGVVAQTTIEVRVLDRVVARCRERFQEVAVYNTICDATSVRQTEAEILARRADVMIVVGGRNSSNTNKLVKICKAHQKDTYLIETMEEVSQAWLQGKHKIGITGGASTPVEYVDAVGDFVAAMVVRLKGPTGKQGGESNEDPYRGTVLSGACSPSL